MLANCSANTSCEGEFIVLFLINIELSETFVFQVVEVCQELSLSMGLIQDAITATIAALIKELKRTNKVDW